MCRATIVICSHITTVPGGIQGLLPLFQRAKQGLLPLFQGALQGLLPLFQRVKQGLLPLFQRAYKAPLARSQTLNLLTIVSSCHAKLANVYMRTQARTRAALRLLVVATDVGWSDSVVCRQSLALVLTLWLSVSCLYLEPAARRKLIVALFLSNFRSSDCSFERSFSPWQQAAFSMRC